MRTTSKSSQEWQIQNDSKPLWTRPPREVSTFSVHSDHSVRPSSLSYLRILSCSNVDTKHGQCKKLTNGSEFCQLPISASGSSSLWSGHHRCQISRHSVFKVSKQDMDNARSWPTAQSCATFRSLTSASSSVCISKEELPVVKSDSMTRR